MRAHSQIDYLEGGLECLKHLQAQGGNEIHPDGSGAIFRRNYGSNDQSPLVKKKRAQKSGHSGKSKPRLQSKACVLM